MVVATPDVRLLTIDSRRVLPRTIPLQDVVFNLQRLAGLLHAVERRDASRMAEAFEDRCHQPYPEPLVPVLRRALALRHPDILGVCLSGAGPSVVAFVRRNPSSVQRALDGLVSPREHAVHGAHLRDSSTAIAKVCSQVTRTINRLAIEEKSPPAHAIVVPAP